MPDSSDVVDTECRFLMIEFPVVFQQSLSKDQHGDIAQFLDDDIFRIAIHGNIGYIGPGKHLDDIFQSVSIRIGFQNRENSGLRLDGL